MVSYFFRGLDTWKQPHCNASGRMGIGLGRIGGIFGMIPMADFFSLLNYVHHIRITCYKNLSWLLYVFTIFQVRPVTSWFITSARYWPDISSPTSRVFGKHQPRSHDVFFIGGPEWGKDFADNQAVGQGVSHGGMADGVMTDMVGTWVIFVDSIYLVENCCDVNSRVFCWICVRYIMNLTI